MKKQEKKLNRLKEVIKENGRTNKWIAKQLDKDVVTISRWCRNVQQPNLEMLYKLANLLQVHVCELLVDQKDIT